MCIPLFAVMCRSLEIYGSLLHICRFENTHYSDALFRSSTLNGPTHGGRRTFIYINIYVSFAYVYVSFWICVAPFLDMCRSLLHICGSENEHYPNAKFNIERTDTWEEA